MADYAEKMLAIVECELCDDDGVRLNGINRCDHIDYGTIAKRGKALCVEQLKKAGK